MKEFISAMSDQELKAEALSLTEQIYNGTYEEDFVASDFVTLSALTSQLKMVYEEIMRRIP